MAWFHRAWRLAVLASALGLGACQSTGPALAPSPSGVPVAMEIIGPPPAVRTAFANEMAGAAAERQVDLVGVDAPARYRLRGYLSSGTSPEGQGELTYVWEVFDQQKRRARRLAGTSPMEGAATDWAALDRDALGRVAAQSMDEIALFLREAKAGQPAGATAAAAEPSDPGLALAAP